MPKTPTLVIPARYQSSRYPGKPLVKLLGTEAIVWSYRAAVKCSGGAPVYVATDDNRIREVVEKVGGKVIMTSEGCRNGTERVAEAAHLLGLKDDDIAINFQGDSMLTPDWFVPALMQKLLADTGAHMSTPVIRCDNEFYKKLIDERKAGRVGGTTVVMDQTQRAMYFSKEVVPFIGGKVDLTATPVFHHVGLYCYRVGALKEYMKWDMGPLEKAEGLEQMRFLENGKKIACAEVDLKGFGFWELNNPEDAPIIEAEMKKRGFKSA